MDVQNLRELQKQVKKNMSSSTPKVYIDFRSETYEGDGDEEEEEEEESVGGSLAYTASEEVAGSSQIDD